MKILLVFSAFLAILSAEGLNVCDKLTKENFAKQNFVLEVDMAECDGSVLKIEQLGRLFEISKNIRGERPNCVGSGVFNKNLNALIFKILQASFAPESYAKTLASPQIAEAAKDAQTRYFRYWAHESLYNFLAYKEFFKVYGDSLTPLVKFYENKGIDSASAAYYATNVANEFLTFAVGTPKNSAELTREQKSVISGDLEQISAELSRNLSVAELTKMLDIALLYERDQQILRALINRGASVNFGDETPLFYALKNPKNMEFLLKLGANANAKNSFGKTPLFYAVGFNDERAVKILLAANADVNARYIDENTKNALLNLGGENLGACALEHTSRSVLMHAASHAGAKILQILIDAGADISAIDDAGFNAMDYAQAAKNEAAIKILKDLGLQSNFDNERGEQ